jgi:hypothetical protein
MNTTENPDSSTLISTGSNGVTRVFEDGEEVFPCTCGETHRGEHGVCTYMEHTCLHGEGIVRVHDDIGYCSQCGRSFEIKDCRDKLDDDTR